MRSGNPEWHDLRWWQPWAALALFTFLLQFAWEMLQVPFYRGMSGMPHWEGVRTCTIATMGDVAIMLGAYAAVAVVTRDRWWLHAPSTRALVSLVVVGEVITIVVESLNVYLWGRWAYAPAMPIILGIGLMPLLQWLVLPLVTLWLTRRHLGAAPMAVGRFPRDA